MGTRADFYVGRGKKARWIGSTAWDGSPEGLDLTTTEMKQYTPQLALKIHKPFPKGEHILEATTEKEFLDRFDDYVQNRDDVTLPEHGWPWPWPNSQTTDYIYSFFKGAVHVSAFGHRWLSAKGLTPKRVGKKLSTRGTRIYFPDMTKSSRVTMGKRSGIMVIEQDQEGNVGIVEHNDDGPPEAGV